MTTALADYEFECVWYDNLRLGNGTPYHELEFTAGKPDIRGAWRPHPNGDGRKAPRQHLDGTVLQMTFGLEGDTPAGVMNLQRELRRAWQADNTRRYPTRVVEFSFRVPGGPVKRVFGRPGAFDPATSSNVAVGYSAVVVEFECQDHLAYSPEQTQTIRFGNSATGGYTVPYTVPLAIATTAQRSDLVNVNGDSATPAVLEIHGPIAGPVIENLGIWEVSLPTLVLAKGQVATLNPWIHAQTATLGDGANIRGLFDRSKAMLSDLVLYPGENILNLTGVDPTFSSFVRVTWADADLLEV